MITNQKQEKEQIQLSLIASKANSEIVIDTDVLEEELNKIPNVAITEKESEKWIVTGTKTGKIYEISISNGTVNECNESNIQIVKTTDKIFIRKSNDEDSGKEKLNFSSDLIKSGGTWSSSDSNIVSIDNTGNIEWKSVGKTTITYSKNNKKEVFNIICKYAISNSVNGWNVSHNMGTNGMSSPYGTHSVLDVIVHDNAICADAADNIGTYDVTIWRTVDLTNVNTIKYKGFYWNDHGVQVPNGYKSGIVDISELKDDKLDANCTYKNEYSVVKNVERTEDSFDAEHNVNELSGEHIIAFTTTHANIQGYTNLSGYTSEILFEP